MSADEQKGTALQYRQIARKFRKNGKGNLRGMLSTARSKRHCSTDAMVKPIIQCRHALHRRLRNVGRVRSDEYHSPHVGVHLECAQRKTRLICLVEQGALSVSIT
nr:hypothetical protein CFP56_64126 [Quercus suber]